MAEIRDINLQHDGTFIPVNLKKSDSNAIIKNEEGLLLERSVGINSYEVILKDQLDVKNYALCFVNIFKSLRKDSWGSTILLGDEEYPLQIQFYNIWRPYFSGGDISKDTSYLNIVRDWVGTIVVDLYSKYGFAQNPVGTKSDKEEGYIKDVSFIFDRTEDPDILNKLKVTIYNKLNWINRTSFSSVQEYFNTLGVNLQGAYYPTFSAGFTWDRNILSDTEDSAVEGENYGYNVPTFKKREFVQSYFQILMTKYCEDSHLWKEYIYNIPTKIVIENKLIWILTGSGLIKESDYIYKTTASWSAMQEKQQWVDTSTGYLNDVNYYLTYIQSVLDYINKQFKNIGSVNSKVSTEYKAIGEKVNKKAGEYYSQIDVGDLPDYPQVSNVKDDFDNEYDDYEEIISNIQNNYDSYTDIKADIKGYYDAVKADKDHIEDLIEAEGDLSDMLSYRNDAANKYSATTTKLNSADNEYNRILNEYKDLIFNSLTKLKDLANTLNDTVKEAQADIAQEQIKEDSKFLNKDYIREGYYISNSGEIVDVGTTSGVYWCVTNFYQIPPDADFLIFDSSDVAFSDTYLRFSQSDMDSTRGNETLTFQALGTYKKVNITALKNRLPYFCMDFMSSKKQEFFKNVSILFEKISDPDMVNLAAEIDKLQNPDYSVESYDSSLEALEMEFEAPERKDAEVVPYNWSVGFQVWCPDLNLLSYHLLPIGYNANFIDKNLGQEDGNKAFGLFKYIELRAKFESKISSALFMFAFQYINGAESDEENFGIRLTMID